MHVAIIYVSFNTSHIAITVMIWGNDIDAI